MSDLIQQVLTALADAGLGNESAAEASAVGCQADWDKALNLVISIKSKLNSGEPTDEEIETCARGFFEDTPGPINWDAVSEVSKQAWLHAVKEVLAAVNATKAKEQQRTRTQSSSTSSTRRSSPDARSA